MFNQTFFNQTFNEVFSCYKKFDADKAPCETVDFEITRGSRSTFAVRFFDYDSNNFAINFSILNSEAYLNDMLVEVIRCFTDYDYLKSCLVKARLMQLEYEKNQKQLKEEES